MRIIDEFVKHINNGESSFIIDADKTDRKTLFTCATIGKAQFVYSAYSFGSVIDIDKMEICAIVSNNKFYIVNSYDLDLWRNKELPENVIMFDEAVTDFNSKAESYLSKYYDSLSIDGAYEGRKEQIFQEAREYIFDDKGQPALMMKWISSSELSQYDIKNILTGIVDFEKLVLAKLENDKKYWMSVKAHRIAVENLMNDPNTVKPFEMEIAKALRSVDAKTLKVEFEMNGKTAIGKIEPYHLMRILINDDCFSGYNFCTTKEGDAIIDKLGASTWSRDGEDKVLTCRNITKITYGKKELYVRK